MSIKSKIVVTLVVVVAFAIAGVYYFIVTPRIRMAEFQGKLGSVSGISFMCERIIYEFNDSEVGEMVAAIRSVALDGYDRYQSQRGQIITFRWADGSSSDLYVNGFEDSVEFYFSNGGGFFRSRDASYLLMRVRYKMGVTDADEIYDHYIGNDGGE